MSRNLKPAQKAAAIAKILSALKNCSTVEAACSWAGIALRTWYLWVAKDPALKAEYEAAIAQSEISAVAAIVKDKSWQSKAWLLERRFRDRWAQKQQVEIVTTPQDNPYAKLTRDQARQALDILDAIERGESPALATAPAPKLNRSKKPPR